MHQLFRPCHVLIQAVAVALISSLGVSGAADATTDDRLLSPTVKQVGTFAGVPYVQYDGIFEGDTSTGAFRVPYRITAPTDPSLGNATVLVEPSHFVIGLGALNIYLRPDLLFTRGFAHAGVGWSTTSFGPGADQRILDPSAPGVFIEGGVEDSGGRTDHEIITEFAKALATDPEAGSMLGRVSRRYATGFSDSSFAIMDLVTSGRAANVFDLALPFTTEGADPQLAIAARRYSGKLVIVNSEAEVSDNLVDRGVAPNHYRFYAVAGTPHIPDFLDVPFFSSGSTPASWVPALRAHFLQGHRWVVTGAPPPSSYHLKTAADREVARDANGNAIAVNASGQPVPRLPFLELGEARFVTGFTGSYADVRTIAQLGFGAHAAYAKAFRDRLAAYLKAGYILSDDAASMRARSGLCVPLTYTETYRDHYEQFVAIASCTTA
ncbi:alpha/beta hydrolase domain-containing protein [Kribbella sp. NBC_01245]|uniref:alpha/beta hydrolase domain-containing protein n=1 Tax=Kribbella sp. NBC_01245 TaxID=2903578 RepID=UPI002E285DE7|nr:alpha/beta hydrolase domain-containing protein [Kribbella sp. NBC_01245]